MKLPSPIESKHGIRIREIAATCPRCDTPLNNLATEATEQEQFLLVKAEGICRRCNYESRLILRYYPDHRIVSQSDNGEWIEQHFRIPIRSRFRRVWYKLKLWFRERWK